SARPVMDAVNAARRTPATQPLPMTAAPRPRQVADVAASAQTAPPASSGSSHARAYSTRMVEPENDDVGGVVTVDEDGIPWDEPPAVLEQVAHRGIREPGVAVVEHDERVLGQRQPERGGVPERRRVQRLEVPGHPKQPVAAVGVHEDSALGGL